MTNTITLPRSVVEQALEALKYEKDANNPLDWHHDKTMHALRAALEQPQGEQKSTMWMPIETAPTSAWDGKKNWVLVYCEPGEFRDRELPVMVVAFLCAGILGEPYWRTSYGPIDVCVHVPKRWAPLPFEPEDHSDQKIGGEV